MIGRRKAMEALGFASLLAASSSAFAGARLSFEDERNLLVREFFSAMKVRDFDSILAKLDENGFSGRPSFGERFSSRYDALSYLTRLTGGISSFDLKDGGLLHYEHYVFALVSKQYDRSDSMSQEAVGPLDIAERRPWVFIFELYSSEGPPQKITGLSVVDSI